MLKHIHRGLWLTAGLLLTLLGVIGILLPVMPGMIFLAMAVPAFMRCSRRFNAWVERQHWLTRLRARYRARHRSSRTGQNAP